MRETVIETKKMDVGWDETCNKRNEMGRGMTRKTAETKRHQPGQEPIQGPHPAHPEADTKPTAN